MKKVFWLLVALLALDNLSFAQNKNSIKFNIFSPIVKTGSFFLERNLNENTSVQLGISYTDLFISHISINGYGITPEVRFFRFRNENLKNFYLAPFMRYQDYEIEMPTMDTASDGTPGKAVLEIFGGGVLFGGKFVFEDFIVIDIFAGPSYNSENLDIKTGKNEDFEHVPFNFYSGFGFRTGIAVGVVF